MTTPVGVIPTGNQASVTDLLAQLDKMIGGGKTTSSSTTTPDAGAIDQENLMLQKIFADINPDSLDAMVGNILERAKQTFGPAAISANAAGTRAYSDTVLASLRNEAMARATGEAAQAKIDAITKANATAAGLVNNRLNSSKTTNATSKTGPSTLGQAAGLLSLGSAGMNMYKKLKNLYQPDAIPDDQLASGGEGFINDAENSFSTAGDAGGGITSVEAGGGGSGAVTAGATGASVATTPAPAASDSSGFAADTSPFLSTDAMAQQTTLAQQGTEGMGELSEVPALTGLPTAEEMTPLIAQADQGLAGTGELSEVPTLTNQGSEIPLLSLPSQADMTVLNQQAAQAFEGSGELSEIPALGGGNLEQAIASLPGGEEMAGLSDAADLGTQGAGELSEVPDLSAQPSPGAGASTEDLTSTTTGATTGAGSVIGADIGTPIDQILSQQGLTQGSAMPAAIAPAAAGTVIGADVGTPIEQILGQQGLTEGSAMPAAVVPSALDTSATAAGGATAEAGSTGAAVASGGEEAAAEGGAAEAGAGAESVGAAAGPAAILAAIFGTTAGQRAIDSGFHGVEKGLNALGINTDGPSFNAFDISRDAANQGMVATNINVDSGTADYIPKEVYFDPKNGYTNFDNLYKNENGDYARATSQFVSNNDDFNQTQQFVDNNNQVLGPNDLLSVTSLPDGFSSWEEFANHVEANTPQGMDPTQIGIGA